MSGQVHAPANLTLEKLWTVDGIQAGLEVQVKGSSVVPVRNLPVRSEGIKLRGIWLWWWTKLLE